MSRLSKDDHARLTALLTQGDPAGEAPPTPGDMRQLRARVLDAARRVTPVIPLRSHSVAVRLSLAAVGLVAIVLAAYVGSALRVVPAVPAPPRAASMPIGAAPKMPEMEPRAASGAGVTSQVAAAPQRPAADVRTSTRVRRNPLPATTVVEATESGDQARPRQLQFIAPGGTRIVWTIDARSAARRPIQQQEEPRCGSN